VSIIYNALKKTQTAQQSIAEPPSQPTLSAEEVMPGEEMSVSHSRNSYSAPQAKSHWLAYGLLAMGFLLSISIISSYILLQTHKAPKQILVKPKLPELKLSGVFLADQDSAAIINGQTYHYGELVYGMKILHMELNTVTLQYGNKTITLHTT
jgi:hypothetical protein